MTDFMIRRAIASDAASVSRLVMGWALQDLAQPPPPEAASLLASLTPEATAGRIADAAFRYDVAVDALGVCGFIAIRDKARLHHLFVRGDAHGRGIARALWERARAESGSATFTVNASLRAVPVYARFGFVATGPARSERGLAFVPMAYPASHARTL